MAGAPLYLRIGDKVYLTEENEGCIGAQGFSNLLLGVEDGPALPPSFTHQCIFLVRQQQNYSAAKQLRAVVETEGLTMQEVQSDPRFRKLRESREREKVQNTHEFEQTIGREVRYGNVVQLQHALSYKYVSVLRQSAELNKEARRVALDRDAGEFGALPRLGHVLP